MSGNDKIKRKLFFNKTSYIYPLILLTLIRKSYRELPFVPVNQTSNKYEDTPESDGCAHYSGCFYVLYYCGEASLMASPS